MTKIFSETLSNGLKIIGELQENAKSCSVGFMVNTGARDENEDENGISHFLEHMVFKGTDKRSAKEVNDRFGEIGAQANAYTSDENTVYYATVLTEFQNQILELLSDMMRPKLDKEEFNMEKKVILEEIALYYDKPQSYFFHTAFSDYFKGHPLDKSVLGSTESVSAITQEQMCDYFNRRYSPDNMALVIAGNFDWESFVSNAKTYCEGWKAFSPKREKPSFEFKPQIKKYKRENLSISHYMIILPSAANQDSARYSTAVLASILGDDTSSKLYWELVETGLADSVFCWHDDKDEIGRLVVYACCEPKNLDVVSAKIKEVISKPLDFTDSEIQSAKVKLASKIAISSERPFGRMLSLGESWLYRGELTEVQQTIDSIQSVTREDIASYLNKYPTDMYGEYTLESK